MWRLTKKSFLKKIAKKPKIVALIFFVVFFIVGSFLISKQVFSDASSPETFTTDLSGNKKSFFSVGEQGYLELKGYADSIDGAADGVPLKFYEKIDSHAQFDRFISALDKGGRSYVPFQTDGPNSQKIFYFSSVPKSYYCSAGEIKCINSAKKVIVSGATKYLIENNYLTTKIKFVALSNGKFDINSNYYGCNMGNVVATGNWVSKVEYEDPRNLNSVYATKNFPALCTEFSGGLVAPIKIMKTTYSNSQNLDELDISKMKAYFEAGDMVYTVMEVTDSSKKRTDFEILDELPNSASGSLIYKIKRVSDGKNFSGSASIYVLGSKKYFRLTPSLDDNNLPAYLLEGKTIIQYEYKI